MNNILAENERLRPRVEEAVTYKYGTTVGGNVFKSIRDFFFDIIDGGSIGKSVKKQFGLPGFRSFVQDDIDSYGKQLLDLVDSYKLQPGRNINEGFLAAYNSIRGNIVNTNNVFQNEAD